MSQYSGEGPLARWTDVSLTRRAGRSATASGRKYAAVLARRAGATTLTLRRPPLTVLPGEKDE